MAEITQLLQSSGPEGLSNADKLLPLVYNELRRHAAIRMASEAPGQTLQPTALVHEAWLRLTGPREQQWQNRAHFFGAAAEAMRRILIEQARRKARLKRGGDMQRLDIEGIDLAAATPDEKALLIDDALEQLQREDFPIKRLPNAWVSPSALSSGTGPSPRPGCSNASSRHSRRRSFIIRKPPPLLHGLHQPTGRRPLSLCTEVR
jgi:RNA polymerase sigma factor (TIGR02999 family)